MPDDLKVGDTVQLKSGGLTMTIARVGWQQTSSTTQGAWCDWFDEKKNKQHGWFPLTSLKKVDLEADISLYPESSF